MVLVPLVKPEALESTKRAVSPPGVPLKLDAGKKRKLVFAARYKALISASPEVAMSVHVEVPEACHCHLPCAAVAVFAVIATPPKVLPSTSLKLAFVPKSADTSEPVEIVLSSRIEAKLAVPLATGATFGTLLVTV